MSQKSKRFLSVLLVLSLVPISVIFTAPEVKAATYNSDKAFKNTGAVTNYVKTGSTTQVIPASATFTVEAWFRADSFIDYNKIVTQGTAYSNSFYIDQVSGEIRVSQYGANYSLNCGKFELNSWTHVAFVNEKTVGSRCYLNGVLTAASVYSVPNTISPHFAVGHFSPDLANSGYDWTGAIDEVRVYNNARSATNIASDMHTYGPVSTNGLLAYYDFNDVSGSAVSNKSTSGQKIANADLTIYGSPTWESVATETTSGAKKIIKFPRTFLTADGGWTVPTGVSSFDSLIVAGGGGGGAWVGAGAGAGGLIWQSGFALTGGSIKSVVVGQGGFGSVHSNTNYTRYGTNGQNSVFNGLTAIGGGRGGSWGQTGAYPQAIKESGGSGGGGSSYEYGAFNSAGNTNWTSGGLGTSNQGNAGGIMRYPESNPLAAAGGGGAGAVGGSSTSAYVAGAGGAGRDVSSFFGQSAGTTYLAGGGGGGAYGNGSLSPANGTPGAGGVGGGGAGTTRATAVGTNGAINTGGGGGGTGNQNTLSSTGGNGGSGVVYISYQATPVITTQPIGLTKFVGETATFTVEATGNTLTYQWQLSTNNGGSWSDISGATSTTYTSSVLANSDDKKKYRVKVTSTINNVSTDVFSNAVLLNIPTPFLSYNASDTNSYDAGSGTPAAVKDLSGNNRNGTATTGSGGTALTFTESTGLLNFSGGASGSGPLIALPSNLSSAGFNAYGITIDFEANFGAVTSWERIFDFKDNDSGSDNLFISRSGSTNDLVLEIYKAGTSQGVCTSSGAIQNSTMARWTVAIDGATCKIYRNSSLVTSASYTPLPANVTWSNNFIGKSNVSTGASFEGSIRSFRIYEGAYTPEQIGSFAYKTLTYDSNNGSAITKTSRYTSGQVRLPANDVTSRTNYTFSGWFSEANATTKLGDASTLYTPTTTQTIYAGWNPTLCTTTTSEITSAGKIYKVIKIGSVGTCIWQLPNGVSSFDTLVVGGGGGGGADAGGGGGGGGVYSGTVTASGEFSTDITVTVGRGGYPAVHTGDASLAAPYNQARGSAEDGSPSSISLNGGGTLAITANGGTKGPYGTNTGLYQGGTGGTSAASGSATNLSVSGSSGTGGQGGVSVNFSGNGNGGAGSSGVSASITGTSYTYSSGGGGGAGQPTSAMFGGTGGADSGGHGAGGTNSDPAVSPFFFATGGVANTGGGGGAGSSHATVNRVTFNGESNYSRNGRPGGSGVVYIRYEIPSYAVTLVENGGSTVADFAFVLDGTVAEPTTPSRAGYDFAGWSTAVGAATIATWPYDPGVNEPISLYANWTAQTHNVTFNSNGGSSVAGTTFTTGGSIAAPAPPTRSGFTFAGWSATNGGPALAFPYSSNATSAVTLYAKWTAAVATGKACDGNYTANNLTASAGHGKVFYIDTGQGQNIDAGYVAYGIKSTGANPRSDLWVELSDFTGGVITLADPSTSAMPLGTVNANGTGTAFFMLKATGATTTAQSHILRVYNQKPSIGNPSPLYECTFSFTRVDETIKAAANKVDSIVSTSVSSIGSTMTITVEGDSGTIGQGNDLDGRMFWLIPAARSTWPVNAVRLEKTELSLYSNAARTTQLGETFVNTLRINNSNGLNSTARQYWRAVYTFRAVGVAASSAPIIPIAMISSGTQIKHTDVASLPSSGSTTLDLTNPEVKLAVTKDVNPTSEVRSDGTTRFAYEVKLTNSASSDLIIDEVVDTPDSKATYVSESAKFGTTLAGAQSIVDPEKLGSTNSISFTGPITVPANSTRTIYYSVAIETCKVGQSYTLQNTATARSGVVVIGSGSATQSVVTINGNCGQNQTQVIIDDKPIPPEVATSPANSVTKNSATINGTIDPNAIADRSLRFSYSTSSNLSNPTSVNIADTSNSTNPYAVSTDLTGLTPSTTYYFQLEVLVDEVWVTGEILSFTTLPEPAPPVADTNSVSAISDDGKSVTFNGTIDPNQYPDGAKVIFEYAASATCAPSGSLTSSGNLQDTSGDPVTDALLTGSNPTAQSLEVTNLTPNATYCVRIVGLYGAGFNTRVEGDWVSFTTTAKAPQVITWNTNVQSIAAGTTGFSVNASADSNLNVSYTSVDSTICEVNANNGAITLKVSSGNCVLTASQNGNGSYYSAEPQTISLAIVPPFITTTSLPSGTYGTSYSQTINATGGNGSYNTWTISSGEVPPGLTLNSITGVLSGSPTSAGIYTIYVTTKSNGVTSEPQPLTITINKVVLTVTASSHTVSYGANIPVVTAGFVSSQFVSPDSAATLSTGNNIAPTCSTSYLVGTNAGATGVTTSCNNAWSSNYTFNYVAGAVTINKLPITITAINTAKKVGELDPLNGYTISPTLPAGQNISNVLNSGTVSYSRANGETAGNYAITPSGTDVANTNYTVNFVSGRLTITDKLTPVLETPVHNPITFGTDLTGLLNATGKYNSQTVPGTYSYKYVDANGQTVTLTESTKLPAGNYVITVLFTPNDSSTYYGPIQGSFNLTVEKFALRVKALKAAKQNLVRGNNIEVTQDPQLNYIIGPKLPAGQTLDDVFPVGIDVQRENSGTPAGTYPSSNAAITGKEDAGVYSATPVAVVASNYEVTFVNDDFIITEKIVAEVESQDSSKNVPEKVGTSRLNAVGKHLNSIITGTYEYSYEDADGNDVVVDANTQLPVGLYILKVKFTPTDTDTYYGPVFGSMTLTVNPYVAPAPNPAPNPEPTDTSTPAPSSGTSTSPSNSATPLASATPSASSTKQSTNKAAPAPKKTTAAPTIKPSPSASKNGPYTSTTPVLPGLGGLINSPASPGAKPSGSPTSSLNGSSSETPNPTTTGSATVVAKTTVDLGTGVEKLKVTADGKIANSTGQGELSLTQLASEKLVGFHPPGSGVRIEVLGARSGARFVLSDASQVDTKALMSAINKSIGTQAIDFFEINTVTESSEPEPPKAWTQEEQAFLDEFFAGAGLSSPKSLADVDFNDVFNWVGINANAKTYVPGSTVYLVATSEPLVLASAIVDESGEVQINGALPVEFLGVGEHRIRLVGTRLLDGVHVDNAGEVQVSAKTLQEIKQFDLGTQATIGLIGTNIEGGAHVAMRVIPLHPNAPWWTIALLATFGLIAIGLRRRGTIETKKDRIIALVVVVSATLPAVIIGWLSTVTTVVWAGIGLSLILNGLSWFTKSNQPKS